MILVKVQKFIEPHVIFLHLLFIQNSLQIERLIVISQVVFNGLIWHPSSNAATRHRSSQPLNWVGSDWTSYVFFITRLRGFIGFLLIADFFCKIKSSFGLSLSINWPLFEKSVDNLVHVLKVSLSHFHSLFIIVNRIAKVLDFELLNLEFCRRVRIGIRNCIPQHLLLFQSFLVLLLVFQLRSPRFHN